MFGITCQFWKSFDMDNLSTNHNHKERSKNDNTHWFEIQH